MSNFYYLSGFAPDFLIFRAECRNRECAVILALGLGLKKANVRVWMLSDTEQFNFTFITDKLSLATLK